MLDIKIVRDNPALVRDALASRGGGALPDFEKLIDLDKSWRLVLGELETLRSKRNLLSDEIGKKKRAKEPADQLLAEVEAVKEQMKSKEEAEALLKAQAEALLLVLPNLPDKSVPLGRSSADNTVVREGGAKPQFSFKPKDHHDVGVGLGILNFEAATQMSGARFAVLAGWGARLERAIAHFMLDLHTREHGYKEYVLPYLVQGRTMTNTGQLPKFAEDLYRLKDDDLYLIPTSEVPLTNLVAGAVVDEAKLPSAVTSLTPCFRREAGSYGKDTRGLIRNHQFDKVELVRFCRIDDSLKELEVLLSHAEEVLKRLELAYRVVLLCTGDMGFSSAKTYDLEVWMPGEGVYREISSCSTCSDFQARRMNFKTVKDGKKNLGCTLNGSGLAVGRTLAAVLENGQQADGTVVIPKALQPYVGTDVIRPESCQK